MNDNNKMLERVLLMMKYDSSKTLTENSDVVKNEFSQILNEAPPRFRAKPKPKASAPKASAPKVPPTKITASGLSVGQIKSQVSTYAKTPLPNGKLPTPAQQVAYGKQLAAGTVKPGTVAPGKTAPKNTVTTTTTTTIGGGKAGGGKAGGGKGKGSRTRTPKDVSILSKARTWAGKNPWKVVGGLGLTAAGAWWFLRDNTSISACLLDSLTEEEQANIAAGGGTTGQLTRNTVGNKVADLNGGVVFNMDNNELVTGNGKFKGTYSCEGNGIKISIDGAEPFVVGGGGGADTGTNGGGGTSSGGGGGSYRQCPETFPIAMNCKNSTIARVQGCIGVTQDGAFGPKTSAALVAKGADGSSITQATIDKVCGGGQPGKQSAPGSDAEEDDAGGGNTMTVKSNSPMASDDADEA